MKDSKEIRLFINTATKSLSIGVMYDNHIKTIDLGNPKAALERTHLGIKTLCDSCGFQLKDVDSFYCLLGPGSNTGIRLGLTIPRTIYAFNPSIHVYGIPTMDLLCIDNDYAALSDRNGNLFFAKKEDGKVSYERIDKKDIQDKIPDVKIALEKEDVVANEELSSHQITSVNVLSLMMKHQSSFIDFSNNEEDFLPEYILKI